MGKRACLVRVLDNWIMAAGRWAGELVPGVLAVSVQPGRGPSVIRNTHHAVFLAVRVVVPNADFRAWSVS